jgi:hypothetical protein
MTKNYEVSSAHQDTSLVLFATRWASHASFYCAHHFCAACLGICVYVAVVAERHVRVIINLVIL